MKKKRRNRFDCTRRTIPGSKHILENALLAVVSIVYISLTTVQILKNNNKFFFVSQGKTAHTAIMDDDADADRLLHWTSQRTQIRAYRFALDQIDHFIYCLLRLSRYHLVCSGFTSNRCKWTKTCLFCDQRAFNSNWFAQDTWCGTCVDQTIESIFVVFFCSWHRKIITLKSKIKIFTQDRSIYAQR